MNSSVSLLFNVLPTGEVTQLEIQRGRQMIILLATNLQRGIFSFAPIPEEAMLRACIPLKSMIFGRVLNSRTSESIASMVIIRPAITTGSTD